MIPTDRTIWNWFSIPIPTEKIPKLNSTDVSREVLFNWNRIWRSFMKKKNNNLLLQKCAI